MVIVFTCELLSKECYGSAPIKWICSHHASMRRLLINPTFTDFVSMPFWVHHKCLLMRTVWGTHSVIPNNIRKFLYKKIWLWSSISLTSRRVLEHTDGSLCSNSPLTFRRLTIAARWKKASHLYCNRKYDSSVSTPISLIVLLHEDCTKSFFSYKIIVQIRI